jgi:hypothetical protein
VEIGWKYPKRLTMLSSSDLSISGSGFAGPFSTKWENLGKGITFSPRRANTAKTASSVV